MVYPSRIAAYCDVAEPAAPDDVSPTTRVHPADAKVAEPDPKTMTSFAPILAESSGWHYAAWVAIDLRLLIFVVLIAALTAAGIAAMVVKTRSKRDFLAIFTIAFALTFAVALLVFNEIAHHPVFVVEAFFPFP